MRIAQVIGAVTLNRAHPAFAGATLRLAVPLPLEHLQGTSRTVGDLLVVYDELGAGQNSRIAVSEGSEAAQPFRPAVKPVDAYNAAILDHIELEPPIGLQPART